MRSRTKDNKTNVCVREVVWINARIRETDADENLRRLQVPGYINRGLQTKKMDEFSKREYKTYRKAFYIVGKEKLLNDYLSMKHIINQEFSQIIKHLCLTKGRRCSCLRIIHILN